VFNYPNGMRGVKKEVASVRRTLVSAVADIEYRKMLQYHSAFKLPNGNAAFGERRLPETLLFSCSLYLLFN
jgi:hypothetical protein